MEVIIILALFALCFALFTTGASVFTILFTLLFSKNK
jgi:hypothetical protein